MKSIIKYLRNNEPTTERNNEIGNYLKERYDDANNNMPFLTASTRNEYDNILGRRGTILLNNLSEEETYTFYVLLGSINTLANNEHLDLEDRSTLAQIISKFIKWSMNSEISNTTTIVKTGYSNIRIYLNTKPKGGSIFYTNQNNTSIRVPIIYNALKNEKIISIFLFSLLRTYKYVKRSNRTNANWYIYGTRRTYSKFRNDILNVKNKKPSYLPLSKLGLISIINLKNYDWYLSSNGKMFLFDMPKLPKDEEDNGWEDENIYTSMEIFYWFLCFFHKISDIGLINPLRPYRGTGQVWAKRKYIDSRDLPMMISNIGETELWATLLSLYIYTKNPANGNSLREITQLKKLYTGFINLETSHNGHLLHYLNGLLFLKTRPTVRHINRWVMNIEIAYNGPIHGVKKMAKAYFYGATLFIKTAITEEDDMEITIVNELKSALNPYKRYRYPG